MGRIQTFWAALGLTVRKLTSVGHPIYITSVDYDSFTNLEFW
jgi:hypothetical protein